VSVNDNCHCTGTRLGNTKVAVKVMGRNAWRGKPWGDLGKQTWHRGCGHDMLAQTVPSTVSAAMLQPSANFHAHANYLLHNLLL